MPLVKRIVQRDIPTIGARAQRAEVEVYVAPGSLTSADEVVRWLPGEEEARAARGAPPPPPATAPSGPGPTPESAPAAEGDLAAGGAPAAEPEPKRAPRRLR